MTKEKLFLKFNELLEKKGEVFLIDYFFLAKGTVKRWIEKKEVPLDYLYEIYELLGEKIPKELTHRDKDQFFTKKEIAKKYFNKSLSIIKDKLNINLEKENYFFVEPSVGSGNFYNLMPKGKRVGIDLYPEKEEFVKGNFLSLDIKKIIKEKYNYTGKNFIIIGNPPFGLRGNLALRFFNKAYSFCNIICFILPPLFSSDGKGNPKDRIKGYKLVHTEKIEGNSFQYPNGKDVNVETVFQVWSKVGIDNIKEEKKIDFSKYGKVFSLSNGKTSSQKRNVKMIGKCDFYLPSTCFSGMKVYKNFDNLPNKRGYGIKINENLSNNEKDKILKIIKNLNWGNIAFKSTNGALNLRKSLIENNIIKKF